MDLTSLKFDNSLEDVLKRITVLFCRIIFHLKFELNAKKAQFYICTFSIYSLVNSIYFILVLEDKN